MRVVIVLAFSNDRDKYLEMINRERRNIYKALKPYDDEELIKVRIEVNTSIEDIFDLFDDYQDQIAIFHYGGHARGTHLQLETPAGRPQRANATGLALLMGQQKQLQLVFLNGCATLKQVELLLSAGVRAVIATSVPINDKMAVEFAEQFYKTLAKHATIQRAFENARAFITTKYGPSREIKIYSDLSWRGKKEALDKEVPWGLYINENSPEVLDWKLPKIWDPIRKRGEKTLEAMLKDMKEMPIDDIINMAIQVSERLEKDHFDRIVEKNITPINVILDESNKVIDIRFCPVELEVTSFYISPEQAKGAELDIQANIWSLGVVLYEMVTGQLPFKGKNKQAVMDSIINKPQQLPTDIRADIPKKLQDIIWKCLLKERKCRYPSMQALLSKLKELEKELKKIPEEENESTDSEEEEDIGCRLVTVMSGEISGCNQMLKKLGPEEIRSTMKSCFKMFGSLIEKFGGSMISEKIMGSSFTAFFGLPAAIEGAQKKAVRVAIEICSKLYRWRQEEGLQTPLDIRIGIDTGKVIVKMGADKEFSNVIGDAVTMASRLRELAADGEIYIGPATYRSTCDEFNYEKLRHITLELRGEPFPVFKFLSPKKEIIRIIESVMVGRDKELNRLKLHVLKVIDGEGSIVSVIGEAGIGKSRLMDELKKIDDLENVTLLEGRALSHGGNLSYFPIIDILKNWAKIKEGDSKKESRDKLEKAITNIYPGGVQEVFPFVATLMRMKLRGKYAKRVKGIEGDAMENLILKNMSELMEKIAEHRPLVCIIHDIHWADLSSIELLESLFRLAEDHKILFINELRPNYKETGERVLRTSQERYGRICSEIKLEPLDEKECEILIQNLLKVNVLPRGITTTIANRAGGNPFFIEEVVRSFIDSGVIVIEDGKFKVTEKIEAEMIPVTIQALLMARIDRLDQATRTLLKVTSVIGRYFFYKILTEVVKTVDHINDKLEYLEEMQILRERKRLGEIEYLFKHTLIQEVIYLSILQKERQELHLKVAAAIESVFPDKLHEFYGMLALHYSRGENLDKAEEYLIKAGEEALKAAASREALHYYQAALKIYRRKSGDAADPEKIAMLEKNIALAYYNKGHMVEAVQYFDKVFAYWGERPPKNNFTALLKLVVNLLIGIKILFFPSKQAKKTPGDRDIEIIDLAEKKVTALSIVDTNRMFMDIIGSVRWFKKIDLTETGKLTTICSGISAILSLTGISFKISGKVLQYAKSSIYRTKEDKPLLVYNISKLFHNAFAGNWDKKCECDENLIDRNLDIGEVLTASVFLGYSAVIKIVQGNFSQSHLLLKKLDKIGEDYDNDYARVTKYILNALLLWQCKKLTDALDEIDKGFSIANRAGHNMAAVFISGTKSFIQILLEDIEGAKNSLSKARELASHEKWIIPFYIGSVLVSQFLLDLYVLEEAIHSKNPKITQFRKEAYNNGKVAVKNSMKVVPLKLFTFKLMGVYYWLMGKQKKALAWWGKSIRMGKKLGARPELARTYMEVGKRLLDKKSKFKQLNGIKAEEYLAKAYVLFKEMELERDLEELDKIKSQIEEGE